MRSWSTFVRQTSALCFILAIALAIVLLTMKYEVQSLKDELGALDREIVRERETIQVLHAEFAYLTQPERLNRLANAHLGLAPVQPRQLTSFAGLDAALAQAAAPPAKASKKGGGHNRGKTYGSAETGGVRIASRGRVDPQGGNR
jgi:cell division protein FtsL